MDEPPKTAEGVQDRPSADCYANADRGMMQWGQGVRARLLAPLLKLLIDARVNADHVTLLALCIGLLFCPLFFFWRGAALLALAIHVALDGLDGPLARARGEASRKGSFTDTMADQLVVAATTVTLVYAKHLGIVEGSIYVLAYTLAVGFSMIRNALGIPYSWLVRPRFFVYFWLLIEFYFLPGSLPYIVWFFNALLAWKVYTGFRKIRRKI